MTPPDAAVFDDLPGWAVADHAAAWSVFRRGAEPIAAGATELRRARLTPSALRRLCAEALSMPDRLAAAEARRFFESAFRPRPVAPADGFLTGYYEPVVEGALTQSPGFSAPVIDRPAEWERLAAAGAPDRAALERFALSAAARPAVWLRDWTEVFLVHVQGSARVRLHNGAEHRLVYAGRNGLPYTSIGRRLIDTGRIAAAEMSLGRLKAWLRRAGQEPGDPGRALMQENRSYIFFRLEPVAAPGTGPVGGQGVPLQAGVSIAVDRAIWPYGLPFVLSADESVPGFGTAPFSGLFIAQDTGSAIVGAARADLFVGSGPAAGSDAGRIRHTARFAVLEPRGA